jgi:hypothetical protein
VNINMKIFFWGRKENRSNSFIFPSARSVYDLFSAPGEAARFAKWRRKGKKKITLVQQGMGGEQNIVCGWVFSWWLLFLLSPARLQHKIIFFF